MRFSPSERIKATFSVKEFVSQFVELSPSGLGLCPFHEDTNPSFNVNDEENYWYCFTCDKRGSVIDFWMALKDDFKTAIVICFGNYPRKTGSPGFPNTLRLIVKIMV